MTIKLREDTTPEIIRAAKDAGVMAALGIGAADMAACRSRVIALRQLSR
jgi:hypothetical protein